MRRWVVIDCEHAKRVWADGDDEQLEADVARRATRDSAAEERAWVELRTKRDNWLALTDVIAFVIDGCAPPGFPAARVEEASGNAREWEAFRQALRDLPENTADPRAPDWPTPPAAPVIHLP